MSSVLNNLDDIVHSYQQLLVATDSVKETLSNNRDLTKHFIRQNTAQLFDAVRSRETWLLDQADLLYQTKIDLLQDRRELINQAIGSYHQVKINSEDMNELPSVKDSFRCRIDNMETFINQQQQLASSGCINFNSETEKLIKQLNNFGRIDTCDGQSNCQCLNYVRSVAFETPLMQNANKTVEDDDQDQIIASDTPTAIEECIPRVTFNSPSQDTNYQMKTYNNLDRKRKNCCGNKYNCATLSSIIQSKNNQYSSEKWLQSKSTPQNEKEPESFPIKSQYPHNSSDCQQNTGPYDSKKKNSLMLDTDHWLVERNSQLQNTPSTTLINTITTFPVFHQKDDIKTWLSNEKEINNNPVENLKWKHDDDLNNQWNKSFDSRSEASSIYTFTFPYDNSDSNLWLAKRFKSDNTNQDASNRSLYDRKSDHSEMAHAVNNDSNNTEVWDLSNWLAGQPITDTTKDETNDFLRDVAQYFRLVRVEDSNKWLANNHLAANDESSTIVENLQSISLSSTDLSSKPKESTDYYFDWNTNKNMDLSFWIANS
ncbi:hypothetical protein TrispH2_006696 [Trichoplax sp. H2]|nr:hypothetical protein TrispH2_006696 [Trichoplax sp. H2]|eukprot:RDD41437.1 hypothetical protein TrispH2_006696 [Trichoplax sp. H2]